MKVCVLTLGCKVNAYESEVIKNNFIDNGWNIVKIDELPDAIIINTCSVTNQSDSKSRKIIRSSKKQNPNSIIVVCGCSSQQHQEKLLDMEIDILIGNKDKSKIVNYVDDYQKNNKQITKFYNLKDIPFENMEISSFEGKTRGFVKIQDGCNNFCSYCIIPFLRGNIRSKKLVEAYNEIKTLVNNGYQEIVLTGIHTGSYGSGTDYNLVSLIRKISKLDSLERIRISSIEITEITDEFLLELKNNPKLCDHLHIPIQNGSNNVLKLMNRKYNLKEYEDIINKIRRARPNINITTDLIVGFPSESEEDFNKTIETVKKIGFGKVHVFPFSLRKGTAAEKITNIVSPQEKKQRALELSKISDELEQAYYSRFLGKELDVIIEEVHEENSSGHTSNYLNVNINSKLVRKKNYEVLITEVKDLNISGKLINVKEL